MMTSCPMIRQRTDLYHNQSLNKSRCSFHRWSAQCHQKKHFFEILARFWYEITIWTQNRMNCKLCRILRRDLGFIVAPHRFLQRKKIFNFDKIEHWILITSRHLWEIPPVFVYFVAGRIELLLLRTIFKEWISRVAGCCFYMTLTDW